MFQSSANCMVGSPATCQAYKRLGLECLQASLERTRADVLNNNGLPLGITWLLKVIVFQEHEVGACHHSVPHHSTKLTSACSSCWSCPVAHLPSGASPLCPVTQPWTPASRPPTNTQETRDAHVIAGAASSVTQIEPWEVCQTSKSGGQTH